MQVEALFNDNNAHHIHQRLAELLAPEVDTTSWIDFTALAIHHIPALASRGRPSKEEIANTFVGRLGFTSWSAYLTTDRKAGGLGWSTTGWKRYKEAYSLLQAHPWIRDARLKPDQVRVLARTYTDDWPQTLDEHLHRQADAAAKREAEKAAQAAEREALKDAAKRLPALEQEIQQLRDRLTGAEAKAMTADRLQGELNQVQAQLTSTADQLTQAQGQIRALAENLGQAQAQADNADLKREQADQALKNERDRYRDLSKKHQNALAEIRRLQSLSWLDRLKALFR